MERPNTPPKAESEMDHGTHLCYIISQGFHLADEAAFRALIDEPAYRCGHCRRTARGAESLCVPTKL